jgi:hypothetical protein
MSFREDSIENCNGKLYNLAETIVKKGVFPDSNN